MLGVQPKQCALGCNNKIEFFTVQVFLHLFSKIFLSIGIFNTVSKYPNLVSKYIN
jgi:hypothetical protein